jgi:hypothetical protein
MLRPPSEYESTRIELSNRVAKIDNLFFESAIIFFTPKVANKGVNIANLQCTIVQITDRGAWGTEEEQTFTVDPSSINNRKYREFNLTTDSEYSLKIIPPPELRMGILEIYFDPTISNHQNFNLPIMGVNNPQVSSSDPTALSNAILAVAPQLAQAIGAQTGAALASQAAAIESKNSNTTTVMIKAWTGDINNHKIIGQNNIRLGVHLMHPGKNLNPTNTTDVFVVDGSPTGRDNTRFDYVMSAGGDFTSDANRDTLPVYAWVAAGKPDTFITMTEYLP